MIAGRPWLILNFLMFEKLENHSTVIKWELLTYAIAHVGLPDEMVDNDLCWFMNICKLSFKDT